MGKGNKFKMVKQLLIVIAVAMLITLLPIGKVEAGAAITRPISEHPQAAFYDQNDKNTVVLPDEYDFTPAFTPYTKVTAAYEDTGQKPATDNHGDWGRPRDNWYKVMPDRYLNVTYTNVGISQGVWVDMRMRAINGASYYLGYEATNFMSQSNYSRDSSSGNQLRDYDVAIEFVESGTNNPIAVNLVWNFGGITSLNSGRYSGKHLIINSEVDQLLYPLGKSVVRTDGGKKFGGDYQGSASNVDNQFTVLKKSTTEFSYSMHMNKSNGIDYFVNKHLIANPKVHLIGHEATREYDFVKGSDYPSNQTINQYNVILNVPELLPANLTKIDMRFEYLDGLKVSTGDIVIRNNVNANVTNLFSISYDNSTNQLLIKPKTVNYKIKGQHFYLTLTGKVDLAKPDLAIQAGKLFFPKQAKLEFGNDTENASNESSFILHVPTKEIRLEYYDRDTNSLIAIGESEAVATLVGYIGRETDFVLPTFPEYTYQDSSPSIFPTIYEKNETVRLNYTGLRQLHVEYLEKETKQSLAPAVTKKQQKGTSYLAKAMEISKHTLVDVKKDGISLGLQEEVTYDFSEIVSSIQFIYEKDLGIELLVKFENDKGTELHAPYILTKEIGDRITLTDEMELSALIATVIKKDQSGADYELTNQAVIDGLEITAASQEVTLIFKGFLRFVEQPKEIRFKDGFSSYNEQLLPYEGGDELKLAIRDTRSVGGSTEENKRGHFSVNAQLSKEFEHVSNANLTLTNTKILLYSGNEVASTISQTENTIHTERETSGENDFAVFLKRKNSHEQQVKVKVQAGNKIPAGQYKGVVTWRLIDGPLD